MLCGECTITLEDVVFQLGVPITGPPIIAQNKEAVEITCYLYLGKIPDKTNIDGKRVKLTWLKSAFELDGNSSDKDSWAWYRMPFLAPICAAPSEFPLATRWHHKKEKKALEHKVTVEVRMLIDMWCESQFIWRPYLDEDLFVLIPERAYEDEENWCSVMPLIHFTLVEMFYKDRVLRQFGYHQPVPNIPLNMNEYEQIDTRGKSDTYWPVKHAQYIEL
ncbi:hypothetical protein GQ457_15G008650 [Hibiscus cannabinus]